MKRLRNYLESIALLAIFGCIAASLLWCGYRLVTEYVVGQ